MKVNVYGLFSSVFFRWDNACDRVWQHKQNLHRQMDASLVIPYQRGATMQKDGT